MGTGYLSGHPLGLLPVDRVPVTVCGCRDERRRGVVLGAGPPALCTTMSGQLTFLSAPRDSECVHLAGGLHRQPWGALAHTHTADTRVPVLWVGVCRVARRLLGSVCVAVAPLASPLHLGPGPHWLSVSQGRAPAGPPPAQEAAVDSRPRPSQWSSCLSWSPVAPGL